MKYFQNNLIYIFIFISLLNCSDDNEIPEEIIPPEPVIDNSYVLAVKNGGTESFLFDKNGVEVFKWTFDLNLGNDLELLPDGKLIGMFKTATPSFSFGGYGGIVKILNLDGSTNWEYEYVSENYIAHHDVELLPNGNVLFLAWEKITAAAAKQAGVPVICASERGVINTDSVDLPDRNQTFLSIIDEAHIDRSIRAAMLSWCDDVINETVKTYYSGHARTAQV